MTGKKNVAASVLARLKNIAKSANLVYLEILNRYVIERVLKRIELSEYSSKCILKGGTLFILWSDGFTYRPTMDADLEFRGEGSPETLRLMFRTIAAIDLSSDDGVRIDVDSVRAESIREDDEYGGVRVRMNAFIGKVRIPVQFDVGVGDAITPIARKADFPVLLDGSAPRLRVYPRETVFAEKLETIVKRGIANSRMKDYYDLFVLSRDESVDEGILKAAVMRTFQRRKTPIPPECPFGLSDAFAQNQAKIVQWNAFVRKSRLINLRMEFVDVVRDIRKYLTPIIGW